MAPDKDGTRLEGLGLDSHPFADPICYPGPRADYSGLLSDGSLYRLRRGHRNRLGAARLALRGPGSDWTLDRALDHLRVAPLDARIAVVAIGSNASPGQMRAKFERSGTSVVLPMLSASVDGWALAVSAHVSPAGYIPITPVADPSSRSIPVFVLMCDHQQLIAIDDSELNYRRIAGGPDQPVSLDLGDEPLERYDLYEGRHGALLDPMGAAVGWSSELAAITALTSTVPEVRDRCGPTAQDFIRSCASDPALRQWIRDRLRALGRASRIATDVNPVDALSSHPAGSLS